MLAIAKPILPGETSAGRYWEHRPETVRSKKILIVDNHFLIREALHSLLKEVNNDATIVEAVDGCQAMRIISEDPDCGFVVLDLDIPDRDGFSLLLELRQHFPAVSVVVLSAWEDSNTVFKALDLGALGFIPKSGQREITLRAFELVFSGGIYIPPEILAYRDSAFSKTRFTCVDVLASPPVKPADLSLTARQFQVLQLMMAGKSNKGICRVLNLAEPTVKNHVGAILKTLNVSNRTEAVIAAAKLGRELQKR
jgi:DNA-binding NarL/FixJ family response regulator